MEEATIAKIASEALKPVSQTIDALLGPKLQRIKNWSEKRDRSSKLGSGVIDVLLDQYLRRLLRRICGITTIVFPQQVLSLTSIYEPLSLSERYGAGATQFDVHALKPGENYLIVDSAGMGKSTFAKHFALEILKDTARIPIFLELRRISGAESLLEKIAGEIDETGKDVDDKLLLMLLDEGNFVIILDGYDEIPDEHREKIGRQIADLAVRWDSNSLILTARPEVNLPEIAKSKAFTINPLTRAQAESLVLRYDAVANIDVGKNLIKQFDVVSEQFLRTPLLVVLLYRTYGFNQSIATRISTFYDEVFNALYKGHDLTKAGFARAKSSKLDSEDFRRLLRGFSFLLAAHSKENLKSQSEALTIVDEAIRLTSVRPASHQAFFEDLLLAVPLIIKDGTDYRFIHKSIGEFFAAEFLAYQSNSEQIIQSISQGPLYSTFINSFEFLSDINPSLFRRLIVAPLAESILAEYDSFSDPYILSVWFLARADLALWPLEGNKSEYRVPQMFQTRQQGRDFWRQDGQLKGKRHTIAISPSERIRNLPAAAWEAITIESTTPMSIRLDLDGLEDILIAERWIPLDDELILNKAGHPGLRSALLFVLSGIEPGTKGWVPNLRPRVISKKACKSLLRQIRQEDETQGWLETLISERNV